MRELCTATTARSEGEAGMAAVVVPEGSTGTGAEAAMSAAPVAMVAEVAIPAAPVAMAVACKRLRSISCGYRTRNCCRSMPRALPPDTAATRLPHTLK